MEQSFDGPPEGFDALAPLVQPAFHARLREALVALGRHPDNIAAATRLAGEMLAEDRPGALALARWLRPVAVDQAGPLLELSIILGALGDREAGIELAGEARALRPLDSSGLLHLGSLLLAEQRYGEAAEELAGHVNLPGATADGWYMLSVALHQCGDIARAIEAGDRAVAREPERADFVMHLAGLLGVTGRYGDASAALTRLLEAHPGEARAWRSLAGMREATGQNDDALDAANRAVEAQPDDPALRAYQQHLRALAEPFSLEAGAFEDWRPAARPRRAPRQTPEPGAALRVLRWARKIITLLRWEMQTRFVHSRLGYVWGVIEPLSHVATIGLVFAVGHVGHPPVGENLFLFYITGVCLYMAFQRASDEAAQALAAGRPQLQLPNVKVVDVVLARVGLSGITDMLSLVILLGGMGLLGFWVWPRDCGTCIAALVLTASLGVGVGMANMVIRLFMPSWEYVWAIASRFLYFLSGIYYSPIVMPGQIRELLVLNPVLQGIEMFRTGFYPDYHPPWLDVPYLLTWVVGILLFGLAMQRAALRRLLATVPT